jgi:hypothetical protein
VEEVEEEPEEPRSFAVVDSVDVGDLDEDEEDEDEGLQDTAREQVRASDDILDEIMAIDTEDDDGQMTEGREADTDRPLYSPRLERRKKRELEALEGPRYSATLIMKVLTGLPRGLPSDLWGKDLEELAEEISNAEYGEGEDGDVVVKIGKRWYYGDISDISNYLQRYKGDVKKMP